MELTYEIKTKSNQDTLFLNGSLDEDSEVILPTLIKKLARKICVINFRGIETVNSCGVRAWINFLRELESSTKVFFEECPPEVVSQINMIPSFQGDAKINSVLANYACEKCDHHKLVRFKGGENMPKMPTSPLEVQKCEKCGEEMEMEELEDEFFSWLEHRKSA